MSLLDQRVFFTSWNTNNFKELHSSRCYLYSVLLQENIWQLLRTVVCCKELFTGLLLVAVDTWYSLAWSCRLIRVSVKGAWRICHYKACSYIIHSSSLPQLDEEVTQIHQPAVQLVSPWDGGTWLGSQEGHVLSSQWRQCKAPLGP